MTALAIESARKKCEEYWPKTVDSPIRPVHHGGAGGDLIVELVEERRERDSFIMRRCVLEYRGERRLVTQYQFLKWPDFDVPQVFII